MAMLFAFVFFVQTDLDMLFTAVSEAALHQAVRRPGLVRFRSLSLTDAEIDGEAAHPDPFLRVDTPRMA